MRCLVSLSLALVMGTALGSEISPTALANCFAKMERGEPIRIVVIGNSVTHGAPDGEERTTSFYWTVKDWIEERNPQVQVEVQTSIIFAIGPELQLFRMEDKVFRYQPDIVIAEFGAANGAWGPAGRAVTDPATEGYIRLLRERLPHCDVILQSGLFKSMMEWHERGEEPPTAAFLAQIAGHYDCLLADGQRFIAEQILAGAAWDAFMKDPIHPNAGGYAAHSACLRAALDRSYQAWQTAGHAEPQPHALPTETLHATPWVRPQLLPACASTEHSGFRHVDFGRFEGLEASGAGELRFRPQRGKVVGLLLRRPKRMGGLELEHDGAWHALSLQNEPRAKEEDDPDGNPLIRHFFHADGLPLAYDAIHLRSTASIDPLQVLGYLVVE